MLEITASYVLVKPAQTTRSMEAQKTLTVLLYNSLLHSDHYITRRI